MNQLATQTITSTGDERVYFRRVFGWMSVALFVTGVVAGAIGHSQTAMHALLTGNGEWVWVACLLIELALVSALVGLVQHMVYWVTTATGILLFSALTAYDVQKLKRYEQPEGAGEEAVEKSAIVGALALYLDFVNLFLYLLRIFGRRR
jgi:FtsH-binding integral membrane protein